VSASLLGANASKRRPMAAGAAIAFLATVATWFVVQAILDVASPLGPKLEAITGFLAIVVLLVVLNWFVHKVYWSEWIGRHHRRRRVLLARNEVLPLLRMRGLVGLPAYKAPTAIDLEHVIVIDVGDRRAGLAVDELTGQEDIVVKQYDAVRGGLPFFAGATLLSDGTPSLIVDVSSLL